MSLTLYNKKRNFSETPEPAGKAKTSGGSLRFVIQKHDATQLHYDFRLEMEGVLKSWAVPKGPSLNPADKRLAQMVEDHPLEYRHFEGVIPEGNYGAGTVILWDEGTYEWAEGTGKFKKDQEAALLQGLEKGSIKITLHGKKLSGQFTLFQLKKAAGGKTWLLVKKKDAYASEEDVTTQDASVRTGKTITQVAHENGQEPNHPEAPQKSAAPKRAKAAKEAAAPLAAAPAVKNTKSAAWIKELLGDNLKLAKKSGMPVNSKPMLATLVDETFDDKNWLFEIKWDGYRALAFVNGKDTAVISRNNKPFTQKYSPVTAALQALGVNAVLDGEIVAVNDEGLAQFQLLQNWQNNPNVHLQFFVFDVLWVEGYDITALPLVERKKILKKLLPPKHPILKYSDHVKAQGKDFFEVAVQQGLEGIMAKRTDSTYELDSRSENWLKIKVAQRQEVIICGYTQPRKSRQFFGALLLGVYNGKELVYVGHTGSGFNRKSLEQIYNTLQPLVIAACPFKECPKGNMPVTWVKPQLVCEIKFTEWTKEGIARHPIFMGLREDKKAKAVVMEKSKTLPAVKGGSTSAKKETKTKAPAKKSAASVKAKKQKVVTSGLQVDLAAGKDQQVVIDGQELKLSNLDKLYWKKEGIAKGDMINYYLKMAPYMLPYLINRPHSLNRHPNGIDAPNFFQKNVSGKVPDWIAQHGDFSESTDVMVNYLVCNNEATLIYMANLGCIEINPWHSRVGTVLQPDWCLIDLDPDKNNTYDEVVETALVVKKVLDAIGAEGHPKTSGSTGMHIYIPLGAQYSYDQSKQLSELIVNLVQQELPDLTSVERNPDKRKGKIYLDFLQNKETQTAAAPYGLRPKRGAPVSAPLHWDEVKKGLTAATFTINNIFDRVKSEGDLFKPVLGKGIDMKKALQKMQSLLS